MTESTKTAKSEISREEEIKSGEEEVMEGTEEEAPKTEESPSEATETEKEDDDVNTKYLRLMADFQNYKKRSEKERSDIHAYANEAIITRLLDVMDNFERALDHEAEESFKAGMVMIFDQLKDVLKKSGVEEIEAEHAKFDPNFHHAVMMEDSNTIESGMITVVLQKGYILNGKVIRPSMVKVAK